MMKKMKKLAALAMALTMTASLISTAALATDVEENEYEPSLLIETYEPSLPIETMDEEAGEEIVTVEQLTEKPCSVEFVYAAASAVDGAAAAPEGVTAPEKIENDVSFRLSKADLSFGTGEIPEGYAFSGWYIEDGGNWYKLEDMLRFLIIYSHTEVYGYWTYTEPEKPEEKPTEKPCSVEFIYAPAGAVDGAAAAPEGVTAPEKIENDVSFRLSEADLSFGTGEIPEGYAFSGWYIQDNGNWYKLEDMLRFLIIYSHTEVYGYWTYTAPEEPVDPPVNPPVDPEEPVDPPVNPPVDPEEPVDPPVNPPVDPEEPVDPPVNPPVDPEEPVDPPVNPPVDPEKPVDPPVNPPVDPEKPVNPPVNPPVTPPTNNDEVIIDKTETPLVPAPERVEEETEISEEETPMAVLPEITPETADAVIVDEAAPLGELPQTGSVLRVEFPAALGLGVLTLSLVMAGLSVVLSRKKEEN